MNWPEVVAIATIVGMIVSVAFWFVKDQTEKGLLRLETQIGKWRGADKDEMRAWINGSFMRAETVKVSLDALDQRVERLEN
jgi:hypothetical protein